MRAMPASTMRLQGAPLLRVPPPRLYVYFDSIVRHGSIRAAAEALRIASSALNRRLLDLEQDVGTILFDRLRSGVRLTPAGVLFAAHVRRTLGDAEQVGDRMQELRGELCGHAAIGAAESAAVDLLPGALAAYQQEHPGMRFTLSVGMPREMLGDLLQDRLDLILTHEAPDVPEAVVLASAPRVFCALVRPGHPLAGLQRVFLRDCLDYPIVLGDAPTAARAMVDAALAAAALRVQPAFVTNMFEVAQHYVRLTDAVSFQMRPGGLPIAGGGPLANGLMAVPLADPALAQARLMLAVRRGRTLPPGAEGLCARLQASLAGVQEP